MSGTSTNVNESLSQAAQYFNAGDLERASFICRHLLQKEPENPDALHLLALINVRLNKFDESVKLLREAIKYRANDPQLLINLGNILKVTGNPAGARQCYEQAIAVDAKSLVAFHNLGVLLAEQGNFDESINVYKQALSIDKNVPELHFGLSTILKAQGKAEEAVKSCREALQLRSDFFEANIHLGNIFFEANNYTDALLAYQKATETNAQSAIAWNGVGVCQTSLGEYTSAKEALQKAVALAPNLADVHNNLAFVYFLTGDYKQATASLDQALRLRPNYAEALRNYGNVLAEQKKYREAINFYQKTLQLEPGFYEAQLELGIALRESGESSAAQEAFGQASKLNAKALAPICGAIGTSLPNFYYQENEITSSRNAYEKGLSELEKRIKEENFDLAEAEDALFLAQPFYLSYQGQNDLQLHKRYGQLLHKIISSKYPQWSKNREKRAIRPGEKIRLGIVSRHFNNHADWKMIISGIVNKIDKSRFELYAYSTGGIADDITRIAREKIEHFYHALSFKRLCEQIDNDKLDILLFPELGLDHTAMKIACLRLATVQCCAWGRTDTSGLPTIDYFLSPDAMETENAQSHYVEQLVKLPQTGFYCEPRILAADNKNIELFGLRKETIKFLCVQSLVKYLPQYDHIFVEIAKAVPNAQFLFVARPESIAEKFKERLKKAFAREKLESSNYVTMLLWLNNEQFVNLCRASELFLDSIGFSGCVTVMDAIEQDIPVVTLRGTMMRGRQAAAILNNISLNELVASDVGDYLEKAIKLANDAEYRQFIKQKIIDNKMKLFNNNSVIKYLENTFQSWLT